MSTAAPGLACWTWSPAARGRRTRPGSPSGARRSGPGSRSPPWTRSAGTRTPSMTSSTTPAPSWTPSTSSSSPPVSSTRSVAGSSRTSTATAAASDDPLYRIRNILRAGEEHLTDRQRARLDTAWAADERHLEVQVAWRCAQQVRSAYHQDNHAAGRAIAEKILAIVHLVPDPRGRAPGSHPEAVAHRVPRLLRHQRRLQWRHRGSERADRAPPPRRPRLPKQRQLPPADAPHRRRTRPLTPHSSVKSPRSTVAARLH